MLAENPLSEQTTVNDALATSLAWFVASGNRHTVRAHIGTYALAVDMDTVVRPD